METDTRTSAELRALGPFVTRTGKRLPLSVLREVDLPGLLEFYDYRARRGGGLELLGQENGTRETLSGTGASAFEGRSVLGIKSSRSGLIRGLFQLRPVSAGVAEVGFLLDESIDSLDLAGDMLARIIDDALAAGFSQIDIAAPEPSTLFNALRASGFPMQAAERAGHWLVTVRRAAAMAS